MSMHFSYEQWQKNFDELQQHLRGDAEGDWRSTLDERWAQFIMQRSAQAVSMLTAQSHLTAHPWDEQSRFEIANKLAVVVADINTAQALLVHGVRVRDPEGKEATLRLLKAASERPAAPANEPKRLRQYRVTFKGGNTLLVLNTGTERVIAQFPPDSIERIEELREIEYAETQRQDDPELT
jgi:hypothetical protein